MSNSEHTDPTGFESEVPPQPASGGGGKRKNTNGTTPPPPPEMEELPEEPEQPPPINPAAGADKFAKFGKMRRDPKTDLVKVRKRIVSIPARASPTAGWFVRTSPNPNHQGVLPIFADKGGDGKLYLVDDDCIDYFGEGPLAVRNNFCVLSITRQKTLFLWCGPLEAPDGDWNSWHQSAHDMKKEAETTWIKPVSNRQLAGYELVEPVSEFSEPTFPDELAWHEIVHLAFRRHLIESEDHPVIRRIIGSE